MNTHNTPSPLTEQAPRIGPLHRILLLVIALPPILLLLRAGHLPLSSGDVQGIFPYHSAPLAALERGEAVFGNTLVDTFIVALPPQIGDETKEHLAALEEELANIEGVITVVNPTTALSRFAPPLTLLSHNRDFGRFLIEMDGGLTDEQRQVADEKLSAIATRENALRAGPFHASEAATRSLEREGELYAPLCLAVLFFATSLLTGSLTLAVRLLIAPVLSLLWVSAALVATDTKLSAVSQLVPPLLLAIATSYSLFVGMRVLNHHGQGRIPGLASGLSMAALTTVIGFLSLIFLHTRAVTQFGILLAGGTTLSAVLALFLTPILLRLHPTTLTTVQARMALWSKPLPSLSPRFAVAALLLCLALSLGTVRLHVNTTPLHFLPPGESAALLKAERTFPGSHILAAHLTFPTPMTVADLELLHLAERALTPLPGVVRTLSAADFKQWWEVLPEDLKPEPSLEFGPSTVTNEARNQTRILIETDLEGQALLTLEQASRQTLTTALRERGEVSFELSSRELVIAEHSTALSWGLLESILSALLLVGALLLLLFRSPLLALFGLLASALPIGALFGTIGFFAPEINLGAAMVAATALGMVSDNTFHLLCTWRDEPGEDLQRALALSSTPIVVTVLVVVLGFSPTLLSPLLPVRQFGLFLAAALLFGVAINLFFLPLVLKFREKGS